MQLLNIITQLEQSRLSYTIYFIILFFFCDMEWYRFSLSYLLDYA